MRVPVSKEVYREDNFVGPLHLNDRALYQIILTGRGGLEELSCGREGIRDGYLHATSMH